MRRGWVAVAALAACLALPSAAAADNIRVQSTTDTVDAGLVDGLLRGAYAKAHPEDTLQYTAVGTGAALSNARAGLADVVITHAPSLEAQFVTDGFSNGLGRQIFYSDYVIVGPRADPAGVLAKHQHDAIGALEDIAAAGDANANAVRFNSRGDNSGTNVQEQLMWGLSNVTKQPSVNASGNAARFEPGSGGVYPAWYKKTNAGQAANLNQTEACVVAGNGCYTMLDRGTFNRLVNAGTVTHLKIVAEKNTAGARGGENLLVNPFSAYIVKPGAPFTSPNAPAPNVAAATRLVNFLVSAGFQDSLKSFPNSLDPAFLPDAAPGLTLDRRLTRTVTEGRKVTVVGTAANELPGGGPISGMPIRIQRSVNNGKTWKSVGTKGKTTASGRFRLSARLTRTARLRLSTPSHPASGYNQYTASKQEIGTVFVSPDRRIPRVSQMKLTGRRVVLRVSEASTVRVAIQRGVTRAGHLRWRTVDTLKIKGSGPGNLSGRHKTLHKGLFRIKAKVTDLGGNHRTTIRTFTRR